MESSAIEQISVGGTAIGPGIGVVFEEDEGEYIAPPPPDFDNVIAGPGNNVVTSTGDQVVA